MSELGRMSYDFCGTLARLTSPKVGNALPWFLRASGCDNFPVVAEVGPQLSRPPEAGQCQGMLGMFGPDLVGAAQMLPQIGRNISEVAASNQKLAVLGRLRCNFVLEFRRSQFRQRVPQLRPSSDD